MVEHFSFYDIMVLTFSLGNLEFDFVSSTMETGQRPFDANSDECQDFIIERCNSANAKIMDTLDNALFLEQPMSERKFKIEFFNSRIRYYLEKIPGIQADKIAIDLICGSLSELELDIENRYEFIISKRGESMTYKSKIQWLENTNLLTTLFYDMLNGQNKGKSEPPRKPMLKSTIKDIAKLINENFVDAKGNPIPMTTLSDYLSTSSVKSANKLLKGYRIEL